MRIPDHFEVSIRDHKAAGYLREVEPESLPVELMKLGKLSTINLFVISCSDGHQFRDITRHTFDCFQQAKTHFGLQTMADDCFHWKTENGGPFALTVPELGTRRWRDSEVRIDHALLSWIEESMSLKKLNVGLLQPHCVCGKTRDVFGCFAQYEDALAEAKELVMREFGLPTRQVICWLQTHRACGRQTHHLDFSGVIRRKAA